MANRVILTFCALSICLAISAQPRLENFSGEFIKEVKQLKDLPTRGASSLHLEGNTLYGGAGNILFAADVSDPMNPKLLSQVKIYGQVRQITVQDGYLYAACRESGA